MQQKRHQGVFCGLPVTNKQQLNNAIIIYIPFSYHLKRCLEKRQQYNGMHVINIQTPLYSHLKITKFSIPLELHHLDENSNGLVHIYPFRI